MPPARGAGNCDTRADCVACGSKKLGRASARRRGYLIFRIFPIDSEVQLWYNKDTTCAEVHFMPRIVPIRDLKDTNKICERAKEANEPIFVTKNGYGALVLMSIETYERNFAASEIRRKLQEAEDELANGAKLIPLEGVFAELRAKYVK